MRPQIYQSFFCKNGKFSKSGKNAGGGRLPFRKVLAANQSVNPLVPNPAVDGFDPGPQPGRRRL